MRLQNFESCSHNSKCHGKLLKVAVIIRNVTAKCWKLQLNFTKNPSHVTAFKKKSQSFIFFNLPSYMWILRSLFEFCSHILKVAVTWLQLSTFYCHISNYDHKLLKFAVTFGTFETISTAYRSILHRKIILNCAFNNFKGILADFSPLNIQYVNTYDLRN